MAQRCSQPPRLEAHSSTSAGKPRATGAHPPGVGASGRFSPTPLAHGMGACWATAMPQPSSPPPAQERPGWGSRGCRPSPERDSDHPGEGTGGPPQACRQQELNQHPETECWAGARARPLSSLGQSTPQPPQPSTTHPHTRSHLHRAGSRHSSCTRSHRGCWCKPAGSRGRRHSRRRLQGTHHNPADTSATHVHAFHSTAVGTHRHTATRTQPHAHSHTTTCRQPHAHTPAHDCMHTCM